MATELNRLPEHIGSRSEEFLNCIVGRSTDLSLLPVPESRIEEYLEYIAYKGIGTGGGGGNSFNDLSQLVDRIDFKNGTTTLKTINISTEAEINNILNSLT